MQDWQAIESLRWIGILSLIAIITIGIRPVLKAALVPGQSVSQTWSSDMRHHQFISIALTIFGAALCIFMAGWLIPTYQLWHGMYVAAACGFVAVMGVAWFPITEKPGEHSLKHPHFIGGVAAACIAIVGYVSILLAGATIPPLSHYLTVIALAYSITWPTFFLPNIRNHFLVLECILVALFTGVIGVLTIGV